MPKGIVTEIKYFETCPAPECNLSGKDVELFVAELVLTGRQMIHNRTQILFQQRSSYHILTRPGAGLRDALADRNHILKKGRAKSGSIITKLAVGWAGIIICS